VSDEAAARHKALSHPFRHRLLFALGEPATISQLAARLSAQKGNVNHHLKVLLEAGMVQVTATRSVRGGTEVYYGRVTRRIDLPGNPSAPTAAMLGAVAEEIAASPADPLLALRHIRLTSEQLDRLTATLEGLIAEDRETPADAPTYGFLVALYRHPDPVGQ
jgi:DNA-binding transcriptional ArsR family regulator